MLNINMGLELIFSSEGYIAFGFTLLIRAKEMSPSEMVL